MLSDDSGRPEAGVRRVDPLRDTKPEEALWILVQMPHIVRLGSDSVLSAGVAETIQDGCCLNEPFSDCL